MKLSHARQRQELWGLWRRMGRLLKRLSLSDPLTPGSLYWMGRKCGKANCACACGSGQALGAVVAAGGRLGGNTQGELAWEGPTPMNLEIIEHHPKWVLEAFRRGEFDGLEVVGEADERAFFELAIKEKMLERLAQSMPTARVKEEVPRWFILGTTLLVVGEYGTFSA